MTQGTYIQAITLFLGICFRLVASQANTTAAKDQATVQWMVENTRNAAGLGAGILAAGMVLIVALSAFGNVGLPKDDAFDGVYAPSAVEVEVRTNNKGKQPVQSQFITS